MSYPPQQGGPQDQPPGQNPNQYGQNQGHYPGQYQDPYQGQGQYGQYPGYQGPHQQQGRPGYPPYGPPHKSYTGIIIAIVVVVFLLLLGGGLALFLTARASGDHTSTEPPVSAPAPVPTAPSEPTQPTEPAQPTQPTQRTQPVPPRIPTPGSNPADVAAVRTLAQKYATAINTENEAAATALTCGTNTPGIAYTIAAGRYNSVTVDSVRVDSSLSAQIALKLSASSPVPLSLVAFNRDNRWCVLI